MKSYVYVENYGCSANLNNSEIIRGLLKQAGHEITNNEKIAGIIIINSCVVKGKTESKIKRRIQDLSKLYKDKIIIISGCMPQIEFSSLKKINPNLLLLGIDHITDIVKLINDHFENKLDLAKQKEYLLKKKEQKIALPKIPENKLISIIQISEGCLGECSYCLTRLVKGKLHSYDKTLIIKSIESDLNSGAKEIWLTSQDCSVYGLDNNSNISELLTDILKIKNSFKLRIGMLNPNHLYEILEKIIAIYKDKRIYKFLHIPIQSASNTVLKDMKRPYRIELVEKIISEFKKNYPDMTIATDIIVGYPTETEIDHQLNLKFLEKYKPDVLNLSKFSSHKGTLAGRSKILDKKIINKRAFELMDLHRKTSMENKLKYKNKEIELFVNSKSKIPGIFESRDENYNIVLINSKDRSILGKKIFVKVIKTGVHHMIGEII